MTIEMLKEKIKELQRLRRKGLDVATIENYLFEELYVHGLWLQWDTGRQGYGIFLSVDEENRGKL